MWIYIKRKKIWVQKIIHVQRKAWIFNGNALFLVNFFIDPIQK